MRRVISLVVLIFVIIFSYYFINLFTPISSQQKTEIIVLGSGADQAAITLQEKGFIKSFTAFNIAYVLSGSPKIESGAYYFSKNMSAWRIVDKLAKGPDLKEIIVIPGMRKEQIGEQLQKVFGWTNDELDKWNTTYTTKYPDFIEGVYFPDTYYIPKEENGEQIAKRMISNFNDKFKPYFSKFQEKNIKWTTALKIASLIEREAGGKNDMPIISGVIWNRLNSGQKLDIDATIQYSMGRKGKWWPIVKSEDISSDYSVFNTYKFSGLPPNPIANPGLEAIDAVLNPEQTDCFYYLHDRQGEIHCSETYELHLENIEKYLN